MLVRTILRPSPSYFPHYKVRKPGIWARLPIPEEVEKRKRRKGRGKRKRGRRNTFNSLLFITANVRLTRVEVFVTTSSMLVNNMIHDSYISTNLIPSTEVTWDVRSTSLSTLYTIKIILHYSRHCPLRVPTPSEPLRCTSVYSPFYRGISTRDTTLNFLLILNREVLLHFLLHGRVSLMGSVGPNKEV